MHHLLSAGLCLGTWPQHRPPQAALQDSHYCCLLVRGRHQDTERAVPCSRTSQHSNPCGLIPEPWPLAPAWGCLGQLGTANCLSVSWGYEAGVHWERSLSSSVHFTVEESRCLVLRDQPGTQSHALPRPVSFQRRWCGMSSSHRSDVGSPRTTSRICSVAYSYDNPVIFLSKLDHLRVKGDIVNSYATITLGRLSWANWDILDSCPAYGGCDKGGWEGLGLDMVQRDRPRGVWSSRLQWAAHRSRKFRCPCGTLGSGAESGPWYRAVQRRQSKGIWGTGQGSQVDGEEALLPGSHAVQAQAWRARPGSEHLGSLRWPALVTLSLFPRCSLCPFMSP